MSTIKEVAQKAGVSVATVSRVINHSNTVSLKTRHRVEEAIRELNYEPSVLGRNLRNSESKLILVLLPSISNPFYSEIINGIEDTVITKGYHLILCETDSKPEREAIYFNMLRNRLADGIILMDPTVNREALYEVARNFPIVQCSEFDEEENIPYVTINNEQAAYEATKYLINTGRTKIAFINSDERYLYARQRRLGFERALKEYGIELNEDWIYHTGNIDFEYGQQAMRYLLKQEEKPTAVFAVSDVLAIGALKEINLNGLKVPQDIAIIGFDKIGFSNMTYPTLTTVAQPMYQMGCISAEMIINKIKGNKVNSIILDHELIIRSSS